jgi:hypothetical protein
VRYISLNPPMLALRLPASPGGRRFLSVEANADHLVIAPGGVFLIDSKNWRAGWCLPDGTLWHGSYPLTAIYFPRK